jgi:hypothetical protein
MKFPFLEHECDCVENASRLWSIGYWSIGFWSIGYAGGASYSALISLLFS